MIERTRRYVQIIQLSEITMEFLCKYYEDDDNKKKIFLVYDNQDYFTNIGYEELLGLCEENALIRFLYMCKGKYVNDGFNAENEAETMFKNNPCIHYILVNNKDITIEEQNDFYFDIVCMDKEYKENILSLRDTLYQKDIHTYLVRIPRIVDIKEEVRHPEWKFGSIMHRFNWTVREDELKRYLKKITELKYEDAKRKVMHGESGRKHWVESVGQTVRKPDLIQMTWVNTS